MTAFSDGVRIRSNRFVLLREFYEEIEKFGAVSAVNQERRRRSKRVSNLSFWTTMEFSCGVEVPREEAGA
ncbi:hypothetical protein R1flu_006160 [Riccia fluitans]|uniref:Uncharacterized protein n=1 Tax=Riccia fluitans TaxID=41844 RepID=A0ABD1YV85_9MARC